MDLFCPIFDDYETLDLMGAGGVFSKDALNEDELRLV